MKIPPLRYVSRYKFLCEHVQRKKVLHLGCVGDRVVPDGEQTLHEALAERTDELWGVDLNRRDLRALADKLPRLRERLLVGDACRLGDLADQLPTEFDIILAGDIIEHLGNPAELFQSCRPLLADNGVLLITTPNARCLQFSGLLYDRQLSDLLTEMRRNLARW
jgi:2-polyprenyl-3-methyl-5-hydroxy-6-metoxy-1,4-benzoquinol methylase